MTRRLAPLLAAVLLVGLLPGQVAAAAPVAVDDPGTPCGDTSDFGGSYPIPEDWKGGTTGFESWAILALGCDPLANDSDPDGEPLSLVVDTPPSHGAHQVIADFGVAYDPDPDFSTAPGDWVSDSIVYHAVAGGEDSNPATIRLWVAPINDAPSFTAGPTVVVDQDSGAYSAPWATDISPGPANESGQTVSFQVTNVDDDGIGVFAVGPAISSNGTLTFTPAAGKVALASITVRAKDDGGLEDWQTTPGSIDPPDDTSDSVTFDIVVMPSPTAEDDTATLDEDVGAWLIDVLANDTLGDEESIEVTDVTTPAKGDVEIAPDGSAVVYTPDANANGSDSFDYTITGGSTATVSVTITPVDDAPVAVDDTLTVDEDSGLHTVNVLANDTDIDGGPKLVTGVGTPSKGSATVAPGGTGIRYTPNANATGSDSVTYTITGGDTASVAITITPVDDAGVAADDVLTVAEDSGAHTVDVLDNDTAGDGALQVTGVGPASKGTVTVIQGGAFVRYTPAANANGSDSFTYTINGGDTATVSVTITPVNDPPVADDETLTVAEDAAATAVPVLTGDTDIDSATLTVTAKTNGAKGIVTITGGRTGLTYKPNLNATGSDTFTYTVSDGALTDVATVTVTITPVNDPPIADDETLTVAEDAAATAVPVLTGDTDVDSATLTITARTNGAKGTVTITGGGTGLTYKPGANKTGADTFTYTVSDGTLTDTATVTVTITPVQDPPNAVNDQATVAEGAAATAIAVLANDSDIDGQTLEITTKTNGAKGTVAITGGGTGLTYDPAPLKNGTDTFTYTVSDGVGGTDTATVLVTITPDTAPPIVAAPQARIPGQTLTPNATNTVSATVAWSGVDVGSGIASYQLQVSVDGGTYANIGLATPTATSVTRTLTFDRRYQFRVRATDARGNTSAYQVGPVVWPGRYQETSSLATYTGSWSTSTATDYSGGTARWTSTAGRTVKFTATGRDIAWVASKTPASGTAQVWVDGVLAGTVDLRADPLKHRQVVFSRHWDTLASHTVEIRPVGDGRVYVDAWVVFR